MKKFLITIIIVVILTVGYFFWKKNQEILVENNLQGNSTSTASVGDALPPDAKPEAIAQINNYQYTETYRDFDNRFSFKYPKDFTIENIPNANDNNSSEAILVQNLATHIGVQIFISPFAGDDIDITADFVKSNVPDLKIDDSQEVLVGSDRKGLAFVSNNPAFAGKSREVWFIYKGNLYQISTYAEFDGFLKGLFSTWQFSR